MKKLSFLFLLLASLGPKAFGQDWRNYSETYPQTFISDSTAIGIAICVEGRNDDFESMMNYRVPQKIILSNGFNRPQPSNDTYRPTFSETPVYFFVKNINASNANEYKYRIKQSGVEGPWLDITKFDKPGFGVGMGLPGTMAALGGYIIKYDIASQ